MSVENALQALSPIDGRYERNTAQLRPFFSEEALIRYRVRVEVEYLIFLTDKVLQTDDRLRDEDKKALRNIYTDFTTADALRIKEIEKTTNHDVKAVEYFLKEKAEALGLQNFSEWIHFGLTSQDINNTAIPLLQKEAHNGVFLPQLLQLVEKLNQLAAQWDDVPMLARTHGQPASPTRLGKEFRVFTTRLDAQLATLKSIPFAAKFGGATGNYNAHEVAFPEVDWKTFGTRFVENILGLHHSFPTTQIEHYDYMAAYFDACKRINVILIDLCRDLWTYISMDYFKQKIKEGEVGSSAMPHKVNPIDFENAEGNLGIANALFEHLAAKLPVSRLQRDLTDSTVLRNIGVPIAHSSIALGAIAKGLDKLLLNPAKIEEDLGQNWAVLAEAIQTVLRKHHYPKPYEALKALTRTHEKVTRESLHAFIDTLNVTEEIKSGLKQLTPFNYTGI